MKLVFDTFKAIKFEEHQSRTLEFFGVEVFFSGEKSFGEPEDIILYSSHLWIFPFSIFLILKSFFISITALKGYVGQLR